jgi:hypothetical protein
MTVATGLTRDGRQTRAALATTFGGAPPLAVPGALRRAAGALVDVLAAVGVVFCVPVVILAVAIPIALCLRLLLWIVGML